MGGSSAMMTKKEDIEIRRKLWLHDGYTPPRKVTPMKEV